MSSLEQYFKKGFDGLIIIKDGKLNAGITYPKDTTREEWNLVKRGMNNFIKISTKLAKLQLSKPKDSHIQLFKERKTLDGASLET